jgi:pimeloyl-ACP methyl ester carboxylesterase
MSANLPYQRFTISIPSGDAFCSAWLYLPETSTPPPVVVMGHGMGATREMRLDAYAERFAARGIASVVFTYRNFGDSGGNRRQEMSPKEQLEDWEAVLQYAQNRRDLDGKRAAVWGTSFGGGHAITIASRHPELAAAVAQCPFTDGLATALRQSPRESIRLQSLLVRDLLATITRRPAVKLPFAASPGGVAIMTAEDALPGYEALVPDGGEFVNYTRARVIPRLITYRPGKRAKNVTVPILFCVSSNDSVAATDTTLRYAHQAPHGVVKMYDAGHFAFYLGEPFEELADDQTAFLAGHLGLSTEVIEA